MLFPKTPAQSIHCASDSAVCNTFHLMAERAPVLDVRYLRPRPRQRMSAYLRRDGPQKRWALKIPYNVLEVPAKAEPPLPSGRYGSAGSEAASEAPKPSAFVPILELLVQLVPAELCFRVRFTPGYDLVVNLTLDLAVEHLQFLVRDLIQVFRKRFLGGQMKIFVRHAFSASHVSWRGPQAPSLAKLQALGADGALFPTNTDGAGFSRRKRALWAN